jgi:cardiolipin synthase
MGRQYERKKAVSSRRFSPEPRAIILTWPNLLSVLRILSTPVIAVLVAHHHLIWSLIILALSAATDGVDGYIARRFNQVSQIGQILDPIADRLLIVCSTIALACVGVVPWWMIILIVVRELTLGIETLILANHDYGPLPVHFVGKSGTALTMISIPVLIISNVLPDRFFFTIHGIGLALIIWGVALYWLAGVIYIIQGYQLLHPSRQPQEAEQEPLQENEQSNG